MLAKLKDTQLLSGAEGYKTGRSVYAVLKSAAENNAPGAKVMVDDLGKRYAKLGNAKRAGKTVKKVNSVTPCQVLRAVRSNSLFLPHFALSKHSQVGFLVFEG